MHKTTGVSALSCIKTHAWCSRGAGVGVPMYKNARDAKACCGPRNTCTCRVREGAHACPARLPHRLRRHCRRSLLVRVEKLLGDLERAELIVPSEDFVVLHRGRRGPSHVVFEMEGDALM
eukprot:scaffold65421_cov56-Phaeocystis_antarctica.AAC.1